MNLKKNYKVSLSLLLLINSSLEERASSLYIISRNAFKKKNYSKEIGYIN